MIRTWLAFVVGCVLSGSALAVVTIGSNTLTLTRGGAPGVIEITITPDAVQDTQTVSSSFNLPAGVVSTGNAQQQVNCTVNNSTFTVSNNPAITVESKCRIEVQANANATLGIFPFQGATCTPTACTLAAQSGRLEILDAPNIPPTLSTSPQPNSTITAAASGVFAPIVVNISGGSGSGAAATSTISNCNVNASSNAASIANRATTGPPPLVGAQIPGSVSTITIPACVPAPTATTATLNCSQTIGTAPTTQLNWPLICPARAAANSGATITGQLGTGVTSFTSGVGVTYAGAGTAVIAITRAPGVGTLVANPLNGGNGTIFNFTYTPPPSATLAIQDSGTAEIRENGVLINTVAITINLAAAAPVVPPGTPNATVLPGVQLDPIAAPAVAPVSAQCATAAANSDLARQCALISASNNVDAVTQALRAISSEELATVATNGQDNLNFAANGASNRLASLRGSATRQSVDDMAFNYDGKQIPMGALAATLGLTQGDGEQNGGGLLDQRFGLFGQLLVRSGDRDSLSQGGRVLESGFDFDGWQFLVGADYRFTPDFVAGLALGGGKIDADLIGGTGFLDTRSRSIALYASFAPSPESYVEVAYTHLRNKYDQGRLIDFTLIGGSSSVASGETDGTQHSLSLSGGYSLAFGATTLTPSVRISSGNTKVDGFDERGTSPFILRLPNQDFDSLQYALGINVQRAISLDSGVFAPFASLELIHEQKNSADLLRPTFLSTGIAAPVVNIAATDSSFGRGELGFLMVREGGWQFAISYSRTLGFELLSSAILSLSGRVEF